MEENFNNGSNGQPGQPGGQANGTAIACLVLGIISIVCWFFNVGSFIGVLCGIGGLICASAAKKDGDNSGMRTAGFICSLVGVIGSAIIFLSCVACIGCLGAAGASADMSGAAEAIKNYF